MNTEKSLRRSSRRSFLNAQNLNNQERNKLRSVLASLHQEAIEREQGLEENLTELRKHLLYDNLFLTNSIFDVEEITEDPIYSRGQVNYDKNALDRKKLLKKRAQMLEERRKNEEKATTFLTEREEAPPCSLGLCGTHCNHFPCTMPSTYQFLSPQGNALRLFQNYVRQMPDYKRQSLASIYSEDTLVPDMVTHSQALANQKVRAFHPMERTKALLQHHRLRKARAMDDLPIPRENLYGQPFPRPKSVRHMWKRS